MSEKMVTISLSAITLRKYHTQSPDDCQMHRRIDTTKQIPLGEAKARGLGECKFCRGEVEVAKGDYSFYKAAVNAGRQDD